MQEEARARLTDLKREFETGQARLRELEQQQLFLKETLLRISGAIQVLEELLSAADATTEVGAETDGAAPAGVATGRG